jgi:hypothetical protein
MGLLLYRLVEQYVIPEIPAGYRDDLITGFVVCLGKCGSRVAFFYVFNEHFSFDFKKVNAKIIFIPIFRITTSETFLKNYSVT